MQIDETYKVLVDFLVRNGAKKISLFGSYARGTYRNDSDLDVLVEFNKTPTLIKLSKYQRELSEKTGIKVDLLTEKSISPLIIDGVRKEAIILYQ